MATVLQVLALIVITIGFAVVFGGGWGAVTAGFGLLFIGLAMERNEDDD